MMNYKIEALDELLNEDCVLARYYPLIPYKHTLIGYFQDIGCLTKSDCLELPNETMLTAGLPDVETVNLFKRFLVHYDIKPQKLKEINVICKTPEEAAAFRELYQLPGVKATRAALYYKAGYWSLNAIAASSPEEIRAKTADTIKRENLDLTVPLMKEVKTHIAVARAFANYNQIT